MAIRSAPSEAIGPRDLALCGVLGAMGLLLPLVGHALRSWPLFMPMHLPLMTLAFLVRPIPAASTAAVVPLISGLLTGMPPFYPPVAAFMCIELATMALLISVIYIRLPACRRTPIARTLIMASVMAIGRLVYVGLVYGFSLLIRLPAGLAAGLSFISGWPGMILMIVSIPAIVGIIERAGGNWRGIQMDDGP